MSFSENLIIELRRLENEAIVLIPYKKGTIIIKFKVLFTMLDQKAQVYFRAKDEIDQLMANGLSEIEATEKADKSMAKCINCKARPTEMAKKEGKFVFIESTLKLGHAPMHKRIHAFEYMCKFFLYQEIGNWSCPSEWEFLKKEKLEILQKAMKKEFGLEVYKCNSNTPGNSNSGKTSRIAFSDPPKFAKILELPVDLVEDMAKLLNWYNSSNDVSSEEFQALGQSWLDRLHSDEKLSWNWPPSSIHAMLKHGHRFVEAYPTPPLYWSEEGGETNHKYEKQRRLLHARKTGIDANLRDVLVLQNVSADPVISRFLQKSILPQRAKKDQESKIIESDLEEESEEMETELEKKMKLDFNPEMEVESDMALEDYQTDSELESDCESDLDYFVDSIENECDCDDE